MSYTAGEALILTRVRALSGLDEKNTSRADFKILNSGKAKYYGILVPDEFTIEWITFTNYLARYRTVLQIWHKYTDDSTSQTDLYAVINTLLAGLQTHPHLGDGAGSAYIDATISGGPAPTEQWTSGGGPTWLRWNINFDWKEEVEVTFSE